MERFSKTRAFCDPESEAVGALRDQLLHAVAAALIRAREGVGRVAFIAREFRSPSIREAQAAVNAADLAASTRALGGDASWIATGELLAGRFFVPGNGRVRADVVLVC